MARRGRSYSGSAAALVVSDAARLLVAPRRRTPELPRGRGGVLYRSGQLSPAGLERVVHERGIKTVVTLRARARRRIPDAWEEDFCAARGLKHVRIVPRVWGPDEKGEVPAERIVQKFLAVMDDRGNYPVLVHCFAGIHRTGTMCAIFRMEYHRWPAERAINEMQQCGFEPEDMIQDIEGYLRNYTRAEAAGEVEAPPVVPLK